MLLVQKTQYTAFYQPHFMRVSVLKHFFLKSDAAKEADYSLNSLPTY